MCVITYTNYQVRCFGVGAVMCDCSFELYQCYMQQISIVNLTMAQSQVQLTVR